MTFDLPQTAKTLSLGNVSLRAFNPADVTPAYVAWLNDPEVVRYTEARWMSHTLETSATYVREAAEDPGAELFRIMLDQKHVGNLRLSNIDRRHRRAEIALIIGDAAGRGQGIGPKTISIAAAYAFSSLSLIKVTAGIYAPNTASIRAFQKAGFQKAGTLRNHFIFEGKPVDSFIVELLSPFTGEKQ